MEFNVVIEVTAKSDDSMEMSFMSHRIISIQGFLPKNSEPVWLGEVEGQAEAEEKMFNESEQSFGLNLDAPKKWAAVCNDINPIHMFSLAARLFGFPGKIAHGNHDVDIVMQEKHDAGFKDELGKLIWEFYKPSFIEAAFKRPKVLPI